MWELCPNWEIEGKRVWSTVREGKASWGVWGWRLWCVYDREKEMRVLCGKWKWKIIEFILHSNIFFEGNIIFIEFFIPQNFFSKKTSSPIHTKPPHTTPVLWCERWPQTRGKNSLITFLSFVLSHFLSHSSFPSHTPFAHTHPHPPTHTRSLTHPLTHTPTFSHTRSDTHPFTHTHPLHTHMRAHTLTHFFPEASWVCLCFVCVVRFNLTYI